MRDELEGRDEAPDAPDAAADGGLWDAAWSKPAPPSDEHLRPREPWTPGTAPRAEGFRPPGATRSGRRSAGIDSRTVGHEFRGVKVEPVDAPVDRRPARGAGTRGRGG